MNPRHPRWQRGALPLSYSRMSQRNQEIRTATGKSTSSRPVQNQNQYSAVIRDCKPSSEKASSQPDSRPGFPFAYRLADDNLQEDRSFRRQHCEPTCNRSGQSTMNYVLQVVRGRSASTTLKLADGVTSIGRHDDCLIRIKSSQVSRRHCELFEVSEQAHDPRPRQLQRDICQWQESHRTTGPETRRRADRRRGDTSGGQARPSRQPLPAEPRFQAQSGRYRRRRRHRRRRGRARRIRDGIRRRRSRAGRGRHPPGRGRIASKPAKPSRRQGRRSPAAPTSPTRDDVCQRRSRRKEDDAIAQFLLDLKLDDEE